MTDNPYNIQTTYRQNPILVNLKYFEEIETRNDILNDFNKFDWEKIDSEFDAAKEFHYKTLNQTNSDIEQFPRSRSFSRMSYSSVDLNNYRSAGLEAIGRNEVCVLTLAGGQASRLGANCPKGFFPLNLGFDEERKNCLFYLQAMQIAALQKVAQGRILW